MKKVSLFIIFLFLLIVSPVFAQSFFDKTINNIVSSVRSLVDFTGYVTYEEGSYYEIYPYDADVDYCINSKGVQYPTTGPGSASWFIWNNCARNKYYYVNPGEQIKFRIRTDSCPGCVCYHPNFYLYEYENNEWVFKKYFDLPNVKGIEEYEYYTPQSDKIRIYALNCFYLYVYELNTTSITTTTTSTTTTTFNVSTTTTTSGEPTTTTTLESCMDSDGGKDYYHKGETIHGTAISWDCCAKSELNPDCISNSNYLAERFCNSEGYLDTHIYTCPNGCEDGTCIKTEECIGDIVLKLTSDIVDPMSRVIATFTGLDNCNMSKAKIMRDSCNGQVVCRSDGIEYQDYEVELATEELYQADGSTVRKTTGYIIHWESKGGDDDGFSVAGQDTDDVALYYNSTTKNIEIYWKDPTTNRYKYTGSSYDIFDGETSENKIFLSYKDIEIGMYFEWDPLGDESYMILDNSVNPVKIKIEISDDRFEYLGESDSDTIITHDLIYGTIDISEWDQDIITEDGIIIRNPKEHLSGDTFEFSLYGNNNYVSTITCDKESDKDICYCGFYAPLETGHYSYYVCMDKNEDGDYHDFGEKDVKILKVGQIIEEDYIINFYDGWNMFSWPVLSSNAQSEFICEGRVLSPVWHFENGQFKKVNKVKNGEGYWVKIGMDEGETCYIKVSGNKITVDDFNILKSGWNQVGSPSEIVEFSNIVGNCDIASGPWKYDAQLEKYEKSNELVPGEGYWLEVEQNCKLGSELPPGPPV